MKLEDAMRLLSEFKNLEGKFSTFFDSPIKKVFVTYMDGHLAEAQYIDSKGKDVNSRLPLLPSNANEYTIAALLDNGDLVSVKSIIMQEGMQDLMPKAKQLDYMQYNAGDSNAEASRD